MFSLIVLVLFALVVLAAAIQAAQAAPHGVVVGDSITVGTGAALGVPTYARRYMGSCWIARHLPRGRWRVAAVSAGVNDAPGTCDGLILARLHAVRVIWLLGRSPKHREASTVLAIARAHGDRVVWFRPGPDGVHPRSYSAVARSLRGVL